MLRYKEVNFFVDQIQYGPILFRGCRNVIEKGTLATTIDQITFFVRRKLTVFPTTARLH